VKTLISTFTTNRPSVWRTVIDRPTDVKKSARRSKRLPTAAQLTSTLYASDIIIALLNDIQYGAYTPEARTDTVMRSPGSVP